MQGPEMVGTMVMKIFSETVTTADGGWQGHVAGGDCMRNRHPVATMAGARA